MGTRGFITFVAGGTEKTTYNHFDSYPDGLGLKVLEWAQGVTDWDAVKAQAEALRLVTDASAPPTPGDIARFSQYSWNREQHGGPDDLRPGQQWYDLLHETQGDPAKILEAGVMEDNHDFPADSLFAEWGYVIDLDEQAFEVYRGFQIAPHTSGRFAGQADEAAIAKQSENLGHGYYPVALRAEWPLSALPDKDAFIAAADHQEDE